VSVICIFLFTTSVIVLIIGMNTNWYRDILRTDELWIGVTILLLAIWGVSILGSTRVSGAWLMSSAIPHEYVGQVDVSENKAIVVVKCWWGYMAVKTSSPPRDILLGELISKKGRGWVKEIPVSK
jgi:hypothetical protein